MKREEHDSNPLTDAIWHCQARLDEAKEQITGFPKTAARLAGEPDASSSWLGILDDVCSYSSQLFAMFSTQLHKIRDTNIPSLKAQALRPDQMEIEQIIMMMQKLERIMSWLHTTVMGSVAGRGMYEYTLLVEIEMHKVLMAVDDFTRSVRVALIAINNEILAILKENPHIAKPPEG